MLTPGGILQKRRFELRKSISQVSQETKIQEKYIKLLEMDDYNPFASDIYISGFLKIYSEYLGLDVEKMLALYRRTYKNLEIEPQKKKTKRKLNLGQLKTLLTPLNISIFVVFLAILIFVIFTISQFNQLQKTPKLDISQPKNNSQTQEEKITVKGKVEKDTMVKINNEKVDINSGEFSKEYSLKEGDNIFTIEAQNTETELKTIKTIRVTRIIEKETEKEPEVVKPTVFTAYVQILNEAAWVQLVVDDQQELAQVLNPGKTKTFTVTKNAQLVTGKPTVTKLFVNNKEVILKTNSATGVASASCTIENDELNCSN